MVAICPNTPDLLIYKIGGKDTKIEKPLYTLQEHTQVISSCDWHPVTNRIVTCSHDRNAYVWSLEGGEWKKQLVLLKLNRAATYVRWSTDGKKFAVATGAKKARVCVFDEKANWWQSYSMNCHGEKPSSVCVDFVPNDPVHIVAASTDRHCRFCTVDDKEASKETVESKSKGSKKQGNYCLNEWSCQGWTNCSAISPSGAWIAMSSQDSFIRFVKMSEARDKDAKGQSLQISGLPLLSMVFISDKALVGGGFDCQPRLFYCQGDNWEDLGLIDVPEIRAGESGAKSGGGIASLMATYGGKAVKTTTLLHQNVILGIRLLKGAFSTCSNDGRLGIRPISALQSHFKNKQLI
jgi:actin related protein 2/3 complex subunit 1A/1B